MSNSNKLDSQIANKHTIIYLRGLLVTGPNTKHIFHLVAYRLFTSTMTNPTHGMQTNFGNIFRLSKVITRICNNITNIKLGVYNFKVFGIYWI